MRLLLAILAAASTSPRQLNGPSGQDNPGVALRMCNGSCSANPLQGSYGEGITVSAASVHTCPNDDGSIYQVVSGQPCMPQAVGPGPTTNWAVASNNVGGTGWSAANGTCSAATVTQNSTDVTDPNGGNTATKVTWAACSGAGAFELIYQTPGSSLQMPFPVIDSIYVRTLSGSTTFWLNSTNNGTAGNYVQCTATPTWSRCSTASFSMGVFQAWGFYLGLDLRNSMDIGGTLPAGTVYLWGAQLENSSASGPSPLVVTGSTAAMGNATGYGARIVPAGANLAQFYNAMTTAPWTSTGVTCAAPTVTADTADLLAPDGSGTATKLVFTACSAAASAEFQADAYTATAAAYTSSVYLRTLSGTYSVNVITEPAGGASGGFTTCTANATSWTRCIVPNVTETAATWSLAIGFDGRGVGSAGIAAGTVYAWGAQAEQNAVASDVCPTAGATGACTATTFTPAPSLTRTGSALSMSFDMQPIQANNISGCFWLDWRDGSAAGPVLYSNNTAQRISVFSSNAPTDCNSNTLTLAAGVKHHFAATWNNGVNQLLVDGVQQANCSSMPVLTTATHATVAMQCPTLGTGYVVSNYCLGSIGVSECQ